MQSYGTHMVLFFFLLLLLSQLIVRLSLWLDELSGTQVNYDVIVLDWVD